MASVYPRLPHFVKNGFLSVIAALFIHGIMLLSISGGFLNPLFDDATHRPGQGVDFFAVYQAGQNIFDGVSIYSKQPLHQVVPFYTPYRYHPLVALTAGIAARGVSPYAAYGIWIILLEFVLLANIIITRKLFTDGGDANRATLMWLLFTPFYLELYMGQFSFLMGSFVFWAIVAWMKQRNATGDWLWITSLVIKSNSVLLAPVLLQERKWNTVLTGASIALALAAPYFVLVPGSYHEFARNYTDPPTVQTLFGNQGATALLGISMLRFSGLWTDYTQEFVTRVDAMNSILTVPMIIWSFAVVVMTFVFTIKARNSPSTERFLLWILAYFLFYKHVWEHQYVMIIPVFVLLYWRIKHGNVPFNLKLFWALFAAIALPTIFVLVDRSPVLFDPEISWSLLQSLAVHAPKPLAVLILYAALVRSMFRQTTVHHLPFISSPT